MQEPAAGVLRSLASRRLGSLDNKDAIIAAGAVPQLVALLRSDEPVVQEKAASALWGLSGSRQDKDAITAAGAVPLLVALLRSDKPAVQEAAAGALWRLSADYHKNKDAIIAADVAPLLVALSRSHNPRPVTDVARLALRELAYSSAKNQNALSAAGYVYRA